MDKAKQKIAFIYLVKNNNNNNIGEKLLHFISLEILKSYILNLDSFAEFSYMFIFANFYPCKLK